MSNYSPISNRTYGARPPAPAPVSSKQTLALSAITRNSVNIGTGYYIRWSGSATNQRVFLNVGSSNARMEVTGGFKREHLATLLSLLYEQGLFAQTVPVWITAEANGTQVAHSNQQGLHAPVEPMLDPVNLSSFASPEVPLTYPGNGYGRVLTESMNGRRYLAFGGMLETDYEKRGFDCTTFPMALFDLRINMSGKYGKAVAEALGATQCGLEQVTHDTIVAEGKSGKLASYIDQHIAFSAGHVVLVKMGRVYEFTYGGYKETNVVDRNWKSAPQGLWWFRKLPATRRF
ncbi:MAG TPA: hypothetical protein VE621_23735 [Bryobacteraceae bacterium]|nr:hypothetical protein [Bryobacteraceae bacterium]